jgi:uncharacterized protein YbjT (DUF2867 family)
MKLVILGASGKTGRYLVEQALAAGHDVTAFVRNEGRITATSPKLRVVTGDARNKDDLVKAMTGQEVVISSVGGRKPGDEIMARSNTALVTAARETGIRRVILLSSFLITPNYHPAGLLKLMGAMMKGMTSDMTAGDDILRESELDWTIVYATRLDTAPAGSPVRVVPADERVSMANGIARADFAQFALDQLSSPETFKQSVLVTAK